MSAIRPKTEIQTEAPNRGPTEARRRLARRAAAPYNRGRIPTARSATMADGTSKIVPTAPAEAVTPAGINHLVINVRDMDESHRFWTEILGFKEVGRSSRRNMRFYSGDHGGLMNHHDIALVENKDLPAPPADWAMFGGPVAINHIAITMP